VFYYPKAKLWMRYCEFHEPVLREVFDIVYRSLIKPLLFSMDAERAHSLGETVMRVPFVWSGSSVMSHATNPLLRTELAGLHLPNPLGMAAGFDKECRVIRPLLSMGFGFATAGTITLGPRPGNPPPRIIRQPERYALLNALGFPGPGVDVAGERLAHMRKAHDRMFISIAGTIEDEVIEVHRRLQEYGAAIELNISSPNTSGLRVFHEPGRLRGLIESLARQKTVPLFVKLQPWAREDGARREALRLAETAVSAGADGLVVANTHPIEHEGLSIVHRGGLSGAPLTDHTARMVAETKAAIGADGDVIACGGVFTAEDVWQMLSLGASAVQLYTAFIYEGPGLPGRINRRLIKLMRKAGISNVRDIQGKGPAPEL
jgi:dihydroorotate dehydrogenase